MNGIPKPLLIVDFDSNGHHPIYIRQLVRFGLAKRPYAVTFLIPRELRERVLKQLCPDESPQFLLSSRILEEDLFWQRINKWIRWQSLARWVYLEYLNIAKGRRSALLFLFLDSIIYLVAFSPLPRFDVSGLMFRPTFYYRNRNMLAPRLGSLVVFIIKSCAAYICEIRPGISRVFTLDPLAEEYARSQWHSRKFCLIPDPLGPEPGMARPSASILTVSNKPVTLLIAGALSPRKGLREVVDALTLTSAETLANVVLSVVGEPEKGQAKYVLENVRRIKMIGGVVDAQLRFVTDDELDAYIQRSDAVLTPYRGFKGSSGIVIRAAHFGKPVISTDDGLLGYLVRRHKLGHTLDVADPINFATCIEEFVSTGKLNGYDRYSARQFADSSDPQLFAIALLERHGLSLG